jgi:hypothetical protein
VSLAVFQSVFHWVVRENDTSIYVLPFETFLRPMADAQLEDIENSVLAKCQATVQYLVEGHRAFDKDSDEVAATGAAKLRRRFQRLPRRLRDAIDPKSFTLRVNTVRDRVDKDVAPMLKTRRRELELEFDLNCSLACEVLANETQTRFNVWWKVWKPDLKMSLKRRFTKIVRFYELAPKMRLGFLVMFNNWLQGMTTETQGCLEELRNVWSFENLFYLSLYCFWIERITAIVGSFRPLFALIWVCIQPLVSRIARRFSLVRRIAGRFNLVLTIADRHGSDLGEDGQAPQQGQGAQAPQQGQGTPARGRRSRL